MDDSANERWILCDTCEVWFHMACVKLNRAQDGTALHVNTSNVILTFSYLI